MRPGALLAAEDARFAAMVAGDVAALAPMLAEELRFVHSNGAIEDKAEFLRRLASGERRYLRYAALRRGVRVEGAVALVFGEAAAEIARPAGEPLRTTMVYTAVYALAPAPVLLAWQSTKAP